MLKAISNFIDQLFATPEGYTDAEWAEILNNSMTYWR